MKEAKQGITFILDYPMNEGTGSAKGYGLATELVGYPISNNTMYAFTPSSWGAGKTGPCAVITSNVWLSGNGTPTVAGNSATMWALVKPDEGGGFGTYLPIWGHNGARVAGYFSGSLYGSRAGFKTLNGYWADTGNAVRSFGSNAEIPVGQWSFIAYGFNRTTKQVFTYANGAYQQYDMSAYTFGNDNAAAVFLHDDTTYYRGSISNFKFTLTAVSEAQLHIIHHQLMSQNGLL